MEQSRYCCSSFCTFCFLAFKYDHDWAHQQRYLSCLIKFSISVSAVTRPCSVLLVTTSTFCQSKESSLHGKAPWAHIPVFRVRTVCKCYPKPECYFQVPHCFFFSMIYLPLQFLYQLRMLTEVVFNFMCMCRWMCTSPVHWWVVKKWLLWPVFHHEFHVPHLLFLRVCWLFKAERTNILLFKSVQMTILWPMCNRTKHFKILQSSKYFCSELSAAEKAAWSLFLWLSLYSLYKRKLNMWRELGLFFSLPRKPKYRKSAKILVRPKKKSTMQKHTYKGWRSVRHPKPCKSPRTKWGIRLGQVAGDAKDHC